MLWQVTCHLHVTEDMVFIFMLKLVHCHLAKKKLPTNRTIFSQIFAVDLVGQEHFGFCVIFAPNHWCQDVFCGNEPHVCGCSTNSVLLSWEIFCKAHALTKVVAWPWKSNWSLISATCQGGCTWLPTWYNTTSPELQVAPLTLAKCELKAWSTGVSRNKFKLASTFFEASLAFRRKTPSGNRLGWSRKLISLATTWLKRCCSKWFWFCKLFAKAPMGLCVLSEAKQFGKRPCLAKDSGKWSIQCHFLINGVSKAAAK